MTKSYKQGTRAEMQFRLSKRALTHTRAARLHSPSPNSRRAQRKTQRHRRESFSLVWPKTSSQPGTTMLCEQGAS